MISEKEGISRRNVFELTLICVLAIGLIFMSQFVVAQIQSVFNSGRTNYTNYDLVDVLYDGKFNEDVGYIYNITLNHTGSTAGIENITNLTVFFWGNFVFNDDFFGGLVHESNENATGNLTGVGGGVFGGDIHAGATFYSVNATGGGFVGWNGTNETSYLYTGNRTKDVNTSWLWFNATAPNPGKFNMTVVVCYNWGADCARSNISVTINDTTAPENITFTDNNNLSLGDTRNGYTVGNYSGNLVLNVSVGDNGGAIRSVFFNITTNETGGSPNGSRYYYPASNASTSPNWWTYTLDTHDLPDGYYNVTVWVNDSNGNINITRSINITVDNTAPTGTMTCSPVDSYVGSILTCSCSSSDALSGINLAGNSYTASPSTSNAGADLTQSCTFTDNAGNSNTITSNTYTIWGSPSTTSGGSKGSAVTYTATIPQTAEDLSTKGSIETSSFSGGGVSAKTKITFKVNNEEHYLGVKSLTATSARIEIASTPVEIDLNVGEDVKRDLDGDGFYDIYVKLNGITNGKANLTITYIHEEVPAGAIPSEGGETPKIGGAVPSSSTIVWVVVVLVILALIIGVSILLRKKKRR